MTDAELIAELKRLWDAANGPHQGVGLDRAGNFCDAPEIRQFERAVYKHMSRLLALAERAEKMREAGVADAIDAAWNASAPGSWLVVEGERVKAAIVAAIMEKQRA